jgi:hypothetical protein
MRDVTVRDVLVQLGLREPLPKRKPRPEAKPQVDPELQTYEEAENNDGDCFLP